ncbi:hypothetical protein C8R41DRAFT_605993 [Lentinula lateritia]|uniref:Uncharacterized protein n=1 Tax=Lentinula lateritia TaxID=40482 RepID=A0ABQ8VTQ7_9AGAR|nr:hypothetical protein C8R41DRAFT_605993 [Lentinula lateritia]
MTLHVYACTKYSIRRARLFLNLPLCRPLSSLRSASRSSISLNLTRTCWQQLPRRGFSSMSDTSNDLFNYSSGRWLQVLYMLFSGIYV